MTERAEALRRFPPAEAQKLVPMTMERWPIDGSQIRKRPGMRGYSITGLPDLRKDYDEMAKVSGGTLYRKGGVIQVWWDDAGPETWTSDEANAKKNFIAMRDRWSGAVPQTKHLYTTMVREFIDELEKLIRTDQEEFYRKKKMVNDAIKERGRGKINWLPDHSLTDLRQIKKEMDLLWMKQEEKTTWPTKE